MLSKGISVRVYHKIYEIEHKSTNEFSHEIRCIFYSKAGFLVFACLIFYRDLVHRQTACAAIKHMALGVSGFGCEDALTHLINYVWPNIFETSPHVVNAVMESIEGMRVALGPSKVLHYCLQVRSDIIVVYYASCVFPHAFHKAGWNNVSACL